jgi:hypothetical protein
MVSVTKTSLENSPTAEKTVYSFDTSSGRKNMRSMNRVPSKITAVVIFSLFVCFAAPALPSYGEEEPGEVVIPTVFRDAYKITIDGKADANGTFSMVFTPHGGDGTEFTVNVTKGMKAKKIAEDVAKELTLAAGANYRVKLNGNKIVVKKANKKVKPLAIEMSHQKLTGVSIMIGKN